jgi:hypothetical protein
VSPCERREGFAKDAKDCEMNIDRKRRKRLRLFVAGFALWRGRQSSDRYLRCTPRPFARFWLQARRHTAVFRHAAFRSYTP